LTLAVLRMLVAGAALVIALALAGSLRRPPRDGRLVLASVALAATLIVQFVGTDLATATQAALLTTTTPLFLVPFAWAGLRERPTWPTVGGILAGMAGVVVAVGPGAGRAGSRWGPLLLLASAMLWATYTVASARAARRDGPLVTVTWATIGAIPPLALASLLEVDRWGSASLTHLPTLGAIAYLGLAASAGAWYLWNRGVAGLPAAVAGAFFFAQPVVGGILAWLLLGERPTVRLGLGALLIVVGVLLALRATSRQAPPDEGQTDVPPDRDRVG
ncbi:MAG TPA: DMT family transporter, partial [Actinomycetota bacterium]|nr:DMT family transporter [Actinomycetota bacterium]